MSHLCARAAALALLAPSAALAWPSIIHQQATVRALGDRVSNGPVVMPTQEDVVAFYVWLGGALAGAADPDPGGRERFVQRFPDKRSFDAMGVRRLLGLTDDPEVTVHGVDGFDQGRELDRLDIVAFAAGRHHIDHRFRERFQRDGAFAPLRLADGSTLPHDLASLHYGPQRGPASEQWAISTLPSAATASDDALIESEPWRFVAAVADGVPVMAFAGEVAQRHLDMSILAQAWAGIELKPAGEYYAMVFGGVALGVLQDAASPFAAVQAGSRGLWDAAGRAFWRAAWRSGGGLWQTLPGRPWLVMRIRHNLRVLGEHLIAAAVQRGLDAGDAAEPLDAALLAALGDGDPAFAEGLRQRAAVYLRDGKPEPWHDGLGLASVAAVALADAATADAARAYDLMAGIAAERWLRGDELLDPEALERSALSLGELLDAPDDPATELARRELLAIAARALHRGTTAGRAAWQVWGQGHGRSALGRLRQGALDAMAAREARSAALVAGAPPPPGAFGAVKLPWVGGLMIGAPLLVIAGFIGRSWRRRRARR